MSFASLREWIAALEEIGQLARITAPVDWNLELGGIARTVMNRSGPALLFENIIGYEEGRCRKLFINGTGTKERVALALGLPLDTSYRAITTAVKDRLMHPVVPKMVETGPVKEVIVRGADIDVYDFPVPQYNHLDGGRYINTLSSVVTMDPDTKDLNVGTYRGMLSGKNLISVLLATTQHWGNHFTKYRDRGQEMPVAVVYGWDPTLLFMSCTPVTHKGFSEYDYVGTLRQEPVPLVKCELSDLLVPASAEIVVEGFISGDPETFRMEGCFGEYPGTYGGLQSPKPCIRVECITHRRDPIFRGGLAGYSPGRPHETGAWMPPCLSAVMWNHLEAVGVPNVLGVWGSAVSAVNNTRVQIKQIYRGHAKQVAMALWSTSLANYAAKNVIVVDEDIDIFDDEAVEWAFSYRTNAEMHDIQFVHGTFGSMLDPSTPLPLRNVLKYGQGRTSRVLIDATVNWDLQPEEQYGGRRFPELCTVLAPQTEALLRSRWEEYGLAKEFGPQE